jgi:hypothetical protein
MSRFGRYISWMVLAGMSAAHGCTALNDSSAFIIDPPTTGIGSNRASDDCREVGLGGRCEGSVPQRCSASGAWVNAGAACELGCREGICFECTPGEGVCAGSARIRRQCSDTGRWVNAPCGRDEPYCSEGLCFACSPSERTCLDDVPQSCDAEGRWQAEAACPTSQSCVLGTGECKACALGEVRSCNNVLGNCAAGVKGCQPDGSWSACSITPTEDACEPAGDDGNCDGTPNSPTTTACDTECTAAVPCGPAANVGICRTGMSPCTDGALGACQGAIWPGARNCRSGADNDCNGVPDNLDETCRCDATDDTPQACPTSLYGGLGICETQLRRCLTTAGGTTSDWEQCWGGVAPQTRNCASHADNDCDGTPDDESASCACPAGVSRGCSAGACNGLQRCAASEAGDATYWGECELPADWAFSEPERITGLGVAGDLWGPAPFDDAGRLAFSAGNPEHIYIADRVGDAEFSPARPLDGVNGGLTDGTPFVTVSGQTLYFDSRRRDGGERDIWRASLGPDGWRAPTLVPNVNGGADEQNPWVSADERLLVFNSNRSGDPDLWAAVWGAGDFGTPFPLDELNSSASDEGATLTRDGLTVFFASNRAGGNGGLDIWVATRGRVTDAFSGLRNLAAVNSGGDELDLALGPDGQDLFFASSREEGYQLYRAARSCD